MSQQLSAVVLAAGQGTRMKSDRAKVLHELFGEPLYSFPVRLASALGAHPIVTVVGHQAGMVEADADTRFGAMVEPLRFALQAEQLGTGHAMMMAVDQLPSDGHVLVLYGDVPLLTEETVRPLLEVARTKGSALVALTMRLDDAGAYGRIVRDANRRVLRVVEAKDATVEERKIAEANAGIYVIEMGFLRRALKELKNENAQKEYYLTDLVELAARSEAGAEAVIAEDREDVLGVNTREELASLGAILMRRIRRKLMLSGVTLVDPESAFISPTSVIGRDTIIHPNVSLRGRCELGSGCVIDTGSVLSDSILGENVEVLPYSLLESARVESGARIGPFARLRPGADVGPGAHVGNFVEIKNTRLGPGAKANHLAYVGDAVVGRDVNVGAGTITCNYDGYGKYKTEIGDGVFIGSNSTLVAPVAIGDSAYVAAGSTITRDVPAESLSFGRAAQTDKLGRAPQLRARAKEKAAEAKAKKPRGEKEKMNGQSGPAHSSKAR
ncbi:MAG: bifunctional UDP-N-acetylglucosamine diphosphorylase/glucosamine-1-phosphate N-acetyltransferase GlmU [Deltaproteobacteria bacterium]|nr:bifunctional UDP-N-acetylglucosamine diphosphorylase/glucosamine-1-phosphate N-acetyltransferase GlmU [Deltaproteobacteria bacterium]